MVDPAGVSWGHTVLTNMSPTSAKDSRFPYDQVYTVLGVVAFVCWCLLILGLSKVPGRGLDFRIFYTAASLPLDELYHVLARDNRTTGLHNRVVVEESFPGSKYRDFRIAPANAWRSRNLGSSAKELRRLQSALETHQPNGLVAGLPNSANQESRRAVTKAVRRRSLISSSSHSRRGRCVNRSHVSRCCRRTFRVAPA